MSRKILSANYTDFAMLFYLNRNLLVELMKIKIEIYSILQILTSMRIFCLFLCPVQNDCRLQTLSKIQDGCQDGRQDGRQEGRQNEALGQYFEMGTYKFVY